MHSNTQKKTGIFAQDDAVFHPACQFCAATWQSNLPATIPEFQFYHHIFSVIRNTQNSHKTQKIKKSVFLKKKSLPIHGSLLNFETASFFSVFLLLLLCFICVSSSYFCTTSANATHTCCIKDLGRLYTFFRHKVQHIHSRVPYRGGGHNKK